MANLLFRKLGAESHITSSNTSSSKKRPSRVLLITIIASVLLATAGSIYFITQNSSNQANKKGVYANPDGSVPQVEEYVKQNILSDPDSFTPIHWSKLQKTDVFGMVSYKVGLVYKGINDKKVMVMDSKLFELSESGTVLLVMDVPPMNNK